METYLEALERLGKLLDAGVLTKEEFDAEKAHLLHTRPGGEGIEEPRSKQRLVQYIAASSIIALLIGGGVSYLLLRNNVESSEATQVNAASSHVSQSSGAPLEGELAITFADGSKCEPGTSLADFLTKIRDAASSDEGSDLRLIRLAGNPNPVEVHSSVRNFGPQQIRLGSLPVTQTWQGLHLTEMRTADWDGGSGFQLRFAASPESLLRVAESAGLPIKALDKPATNAGIFAAIEKSPGGAILTCMKSSKSGQASAAADVSLNETGD